MEVTAGAARRQAATTGDGRVPKSAAGRRSAKPSKSAEGRSSGRAEGRPPARSGEGRRARPAGRGGRRRSPSPRPLRQTRAAVPVAGGIIWTIVLVVAVYLSSLLTALVLIPVAAVATTSALRAAESSTRSRRKRRGRTVLGLPLHHLAAVAAAVLLPLLALAGPVVAVAGLVLGGGAVVVLVAGSVYGSSARPVPAVAAAVVAAVAPALAATSVVIARHEGSDLALALVAATLAYDAGAFVMGDGRTPLGGPVGVTLGALSVMVVAVFAAAIMDPPFSGSRPWVFFVLVGALAAAGVRLCQLPARAERLPALRRIDSLSLAAPVWSLLVPVVLHR